MPWSVFWNTPTLVSFQTIVKYCTIKRIKGHWYEKIIASFKVLLYSRPKQRTVNWLFIFSDPPPKASFFNRRPLDRKPVYWFVVFCSDVRAILVAFSSIRYATPCFPSLRHANALVCSTKVKTENQYCMCRFCTFLCIGDKDMGV